MSARIIYSEWYAGPAGLAGPTGAGGDRRGPAGPAGTGRAGGGHNYLFVKVKVTSPGINFHFEQHFVENN